MVPIMVKKEKGKVSFSEALPWTVSTMPCPGTEARGVGDRCARVLGIADVAHQLQELTNYYSKYTSSSF